MTMIRLLFCQLIAGCVLGFELLVLHTNDIHDRVLQFEGKNGGTCTAKKLSQSKCFGGVSRRLTKIKDIRSKEQNVILLDGGDEYLGTLWFSYYGGSPTAEFMNTLGYNAAALGNHEFDNGIDGLLPYLKTAKFPIVCCNIDISREKRLQGFIKKSFILPVNGQDIGIVGFITPETTNISSPGDTLSFSNEIPALQQEVNILKKKGVNKIIAVGHSGFQREKKIAKAVDGIDVIVGGHSDTFLYNGKPPSSEKPQGNYPAVIKSPSGKNVLLVQDYTYGKYLGYLKVTFDDAGNVISWKGNPILLDQSIKQDSNLEKEVQRMNKEVEKVKKRHVGEARTDLEGRRSVCRKKECNLGNMITDALVDKYLGGYSNESWAKVAIGIINGGSIRSSVQEGQVTYGDLINVEPFGNTIVRVELKGWQLLEAFEHAVRDFSETDPHGKFLQVSGIRVVYDLSDPNNTRVEDLKVRCTECSIPEFVPIEKNKVYSVLMSSFLAGGNDGFITFKNKSIKKQFYGDIDVDVTSEYVKKYSAVYVGLEDRISFVTPTVVQKQKSAGFSLDAAINYLWNMIG